MSSVQRMRDHDETLRNGLIGLLAAGLLIGLGLDNWAMMETWIPLAGISIVIFLFYRLVVAVEHLVYDS